MEDLNDKLDRLLSSPDSVKRIEELMAAFTADAPAAPSEPPMPDLPDLGPILQLLPLLGQLGQEDDNAALLKALRPHLQKERQKRLDDATQMMKLVKLLPLIKGIADQKEGS
ncbi:MAG: hypothetical protein IJB27_02905 [Clostridia bacterium]|nr:hypothetical protein [Clostridia bacterium]